MFHLHTHDATLHIDQESWMLRSFIFAVNPSNTAEWNFDTLTASVTQASLSLQALGDQITWF